MDRAHRARKSSNAPADLRGHQDHIRVKNAEQNGTDWKTIVRRVLQETCQVIERGVWALPQ